MNPNKSENREHQIPTHPMASSSPWNGAMAEVFERSTAAFGSFGKNMHTFQQESARFVGKRAEENSNAMKRFASCKTLPDVFAAQQQWFSDLTRACNDEWLRFGEVMGEMVEDSISAENGTGSKPSGRRVPD